MKSNAYRHMKLSQECLQLTTLWLPFWVILLEGCGALNEHFSPTESWTRKTTHAGDGVGYYEFDQRFEHPGRTWASVTHHAFSFACVGAAMANETWKFVQAKSKQAMKQVLGIKHEAARCTHEGKLKLNAVTPPLAVASLAHGDDMRWNPNDNL